MSRAFSAAFKAALMAETTDEEVAALLTIRHPEMAEVQRVSSSAAHVLSIEPYLLGLVSRGLAYAYGDIVFTPPQDAEGQGPSFQVRVDTIGSETIRLLRSTTLPALVTVELVAVDRPDLVEAVFADFDLTTAEYDQTTAVLGLTLDAMATEPFPADSFTPAGFGGLF